MEFIPRAKRIGNPWGLELTGLGFQASGIKVNRYLYNGKEYIEDNTLRYYDYGARMYDPSIGRWSVVDNMSELYFATTPYAYALNQPTNAIDPDGNIVIFINGNHYGDGGKSDYWRYTERTQITNKTRSRGTRISSFNEREIAFDKQVMGQLNDFHAIYRDGSDGGWAPVGFGRSGLAGARKTMGYNQGMNDAELIINSLSRDKGGNVLESIKIITHSMGGAYGKGYAQAILDYSKKHNIIGILIAFEADFAPFQPGKQSAVAGVPTFQFSNDYDPVANNKLLGSPFAKMEGASVQTDSNPNKGHSIFDFMDKIKNLPSGSYKVVKDQILPNN